MGRKGLDPGKGGKNRIMSIGMVSSLVLMGFLGFITFESEVVRASTTIYVGSGAGNNSATINGGISLASDGDTVFVYSGTYNENVVVDKTINLIGENRTNTIIDGGGIGDVVHVTYNWVNITGFTVRNSGESAHPVYNAGIKLFYVKNCRIFNNNLSDNMECGIYLEKSSNNNIFNNTVLSNADDGIQLLYASSSQNIIDNNYISNNKFGIRFVGARNNNITNNLFYSNQHDINFQGASNNNIISNSFSSSNMAIASWGGSGNSIIGNDINGCNLWFASVFYNNFINNNVSSPDAWNFQLYESSNFNIIGNNFSTTTSGAISGVILIRSSGDNITNNHFSNAGIYISGDQLFHFNTHTIPDDNIVNGKPLYYYKNSSGVNIDGIPVGQLILANCSDFNVKDLQINNTYVGIQIAYSQNNYIINNTVSDNIYGIVLGPSSSNNVSNNMLVSNSWYGFLLGLCSNNNITNNTVTSSFMGIYIYSSSSNNSIYHNKFINNTNQAYDDTNNGNQWDNGYPSGGNYWSDFDEPSEGAFDDYRGIDQDDPMSGDGIVDNGSIAGGGKNPYVIDADSQDNYPLLAQPPLPPTLYINVSLDGEDVILYWDPSITTNIDHYLIYRSISQTDFDFSNVWVNTSLDKELGEPTPTPLRTMWNDTNAASPGNMTNYEEQYYYVIRAVNVFGEGSRTSRTVGKWTKAFPQGISTFSLLLEPLQNVKIDYYLNDMNATYIKWINTTTYTWMRHEKGSLDNITTLEVGKGYEINFDNQTIFTFTGLPGAMIMYDDVPFGFDATPLSGNADSLTAVVDPANGNVNLTWYAASGIDSYFVYNSTKRDGFFGTLGVDYFLLAITTLGNEFCTHQNATLAGSEQYYMVTPFVSSTREKGVSSYSIGVWTASYLSGYDTLGIPLKLSTYQTADWYCDNIPDTVGINYFDIAAQRWIWHSTRMPEGAFDVVVEMGIGYQISTSNATKFTFIGV